MYSNPAVKFALPAGAALKRSPIAFAGIYEEYADALAQSGENNSAQEALRKGLSLREANSGQGAKFKAVRYKCNAPLSTQPTVTN